MPLETAAFISDLVTSNPAASDGLNSADDHMRLIKSTLKNTFPNITGSVTVTHGDLNGLANLWAGTMINKTPLGSVGAPAHTFTSDLDTGMYSPGANQLAFAVGGQQALSFAADKSATFAGALSATGAINAPGATPIGGTMIWFADTLPTLGTWAWCNGGTLSRTGNGAALFALIGTTYGAGDGATTFNVPNMQEVVPVGKSTMGGAASPGLLNSISNGLKAVLGGLWGADTHTLAAANIPEHDHAVYLRDPGHVHGGVPNEANQAGNQAGWVGVNGSKNTASATTGITIGSVSGVANDNKTAKFGNASPNSIGNSQPSRAVNFVIRIG